LNFSRNTTFNNITHVFPNLKNKLSESAAFPYNEDGMLGIYLDQEERPTKIPNRFLIRLWFRNDSLKGMEYNWEPDYSDDQWQKFKEIHDSLFSNR